MPTGTVEALLGTTIVGAATVENGQAHLVVTFVPPAGSQVPLRLRYAPDAPWYLAGEETPVTLALQSGSLWRTMPLVVAGLVVVATFVLGRSARTRSAPRLPTKAVRRSDADARVEVIHPSKSARSGWAGRVTDAHDGTPVAGARIALERAGFSQVEVIASTSANEAGRFELRVDGVLPGDFLVVEGPFHSALRKAHPGPGELEISLVLRRRALLERLVTWARLVGKPFDQRPEATPGHVRRVAADDPRNDPGTAEWADAVERAAFGHGPVDGRLEAEVDGLLPARGAHPKPSPRLAANAASKDDRAVATLREDGPPAGMTLRPRDPDSR